MLPRPNLRAGVGIQGDQVAVFGGNKDEVFRTATEVDAMQIDRCIIGSAGQVDGKAGGELQTADVAQADGGFLGVVAAVLRIAIELEPIIVGCGCDTAFGGCHSVDG